MRIAIAPNVYVQVGNEDMQLLELIRQDKLDHAVLDDCSRKRLKSLLTKGIVKRSKKQGRNTYEVRRDIFN